MFSDHKAIELEMNNKKIMTPSHIWKFRKYFSITHRLKRNY